MAGVAVKVTLVPAQIVVALAPMLTDGTTFVFTVTVKEQFVAGEFVNAYVTVVAPALNVCPLALPLPFPVVAPVNVYVNEEPCGDTTGSILFTTAVH